MKCKPVRHRYAASPGAWSGNNRASIIHEFVLFIHRRRLAARAPISPSQPSLRCALDAMAMAQTASAQRPP